MNVLSKNEARVLGCLLEKAVVTPDQYPLTLNALTNACNQKSSRDPVMSLDSGTVLNTIRNLEAKHLVRTEENFKSQTEKYTQRICNTPFSDYQFDEAQYAAMTVLLLRGPRTPGEIRANSGRLHEFADNTSVVTTMNELMNRDGDALVRLLPRAAGRRDAEYMHLFYDDKARSEEVARNEVNSTAISGDVAVKNSASEREPIAASVGSGTNKLQADVDTRVDRLEREVAVLREQIAHLLDSQK